MKTYLAYIMAFMAVIITSVLGSYYTQQSVNSEWYNKIKSSLTPPSFVFPIVWTILYIIIGIILAQAILNKNNILVILFLINLLLNILWCYIFFSKRNIKLAFIVILLILITAIILYLISKNNILILYILWLIFASILNYQSIENMFI